MSARHKLNIAYFNGAVLFAAITGGLLQSWTAFVLALVVLIVVAFYAGDIRPSSCH